MENYTLTRTGDAPLAFSGDQIARASGGPNVNRWYELSIYRTADSYVVAIAYHTQWQGEQSCHYAEIAPTPLAVRVLLTDFDPSEPVEGYPSGPAYTERQERLLRSIRRQYDALVSEVLAGEEFAVSAEQEIGLELAAWQIDMFTRICRDALQRLALSRDEACLVMDALNGFGPLLHSDTWPMLVAEVEDHIRLNQADEKWDVDAADLLLKLRAIDYAQAAALACAAEEFWRRSSEDTDSLLADLGIIPGETK